MKKLFSLTAVPAFVLSLSAAAAVPEPETIITAATYNVKCPDKRFPEHQWPYRAPLCRKIIARNNPDLIGLQEPHRGQIDDLICGTDYAFIGKGRDDFGDSGEFSCILYRKSRFEVLDSGTFGLSENPEQPGLKSWNSNCPRIATWGIFLDKKTGKKFVFYNTHLDNKSELARINGIKLILAHAKKHTAKLPLMISGDFNTDKDSGVYRLITKKLRDSAAISATPHQGAEYSLNCWGKCNRWRTIDFIFLSRKFKVLSHLTDDTTFDGCYASDHFPVIIKMQLE